MKSYAIWNNKGGTGKSTITFHVACRYAEKNPERAVLVVDLCPQANSSMLLLGGGVNGEQELLKLCGGNEPTSVVGYISKCIIDRTKVPDLDDFIIDVTTINSSIPSNIRLMPGDGNLELMAPAIIDEAGRTPMLGYADPWQWVHEIFLRMRQNLFQDNLTVFFDTNPSFSIYTELAICAATRLLVPINADDSSRVAARALFALLHGTNPPHPFFGNYTFAAKIAARKMKLPKVHLAIGNRFTQHEGAAAAFSAFSEATATQIYGEFTSDPTRFTSRKAPIINMADFLAQYVIELRDFNTAGVVAAHQGLPMSTMKQKYYSVHANQRVKVNRDQLNKGLEAIDDLVDAI